MSKRKWILLLAALALLTSSQGAWSTTNAFISGYLFDPNWYAPHPNLTSPQVYGTGLYEYGVAGNPASNSGLGFFTGTSIYGAFSKPSQTDGNYTLASWDNWWRSCYVVNQSFVGAFAPPVYMRLHANTWSYACNWDPNWYNEFGQLFEATGSSVVLAAVNTASANDWWVSVLDGGPTGTQVGKKISASGTSGPSGMVAVWNGGDVPTIPGHIYYLKYQVKNSGTGAICNNDPIPDLSDMSPGGGLYHNGVLADPAKDLGVTICSDDDGIVTNMFSHRTGSSNTGTQVGQMFVARGTSLVSFTAWLSDSSTYIATLYNGVGGAQIGTAKRNSMMRPGGDPLVMWTWSPGECPMTPGNSYYIEVTKDGGGTVTCQTHPENPYLMGDMYLNRSPVTGTDMAGTIMEEESGGSATRPSVQFTTFPAVAFADRGTTTLTVRWATDVACDSTVQYAAWNGPYTDAYYSSALTTNHVATLSGLQPNTMYHLRVKGAATNYRTGATRDFVMCTINSSPNLLANPGFETVPDPTSGHQHNRYPASPPWYYGGMDIQASDGGWFWGVPPYAGTWFLQAAINGSDCNGTVYQTVPATPGVEYNLSAAVTSWMRENNLWKYDVWTSQGRLDYMRIGIDPAGGTDPNSASVQWTPRFYSHLRYSVIGTHSVATGNNITVFFSMIGKGGQWHLYGIDDCRLSTRFTAMSLADLKANQNDGVGARVENMIVTASPIEIGAYYVETADRTMGIKVQSSDSVGVGQRVMVSGYLATDPQTGERYLTNASLSAPVTDSEPKPLEMGCKSIGGAAVGAKIPAVPGSQGANNEGLVVKLSGTITAKDPSGAWVFINDGSFSDDGIKVDTSHVPWGLVPEVGQNAALAGISSLYYSGGVKPLLIVRRDSDISTY